MQHLPNPEHPPFVSDRLSAVSDVPMQFLVSVGIVAVILIAATLADFIPEGNGAPGFIDPQKSASVNAIGREPDRRRWMECHQFLPSEYGPSVAE
jgi:hypothetical protein